MSKSTHTWKLGEVCTGGIITVNIEDSKVRLILKEWDYSTGSRRSSDQSKAEVLEHVTYNAEDHNAYREMIEQLGMWTTSYHAEKVMEWVMTKVNIRKSLFW